MSGNLTIVTMIQGAGISFVFIPLQVVGVLPRSTRRLRTDAAALYSLSRKYRQRLWSVSDHRLSARIERSGAACAVCGAGDAPSIARCNMALKACFLGPTTPFRRRRKSMRRSNIGRWWIPMPMNFMMIFYICLPLLPLLFFMRKARAPTRRLQVLLMRRWISVLRDGRKSAASSG